MAKKKKLKKQRIDSRQPPNPAKVASRSGSNAGRGFRYQDAVSAWLAVEIWAGRRLPAILIPEGGDDVELRGEETTFIQVKSRREHRGDYAEGETAGHIKDLWSRSLGSSSQPEKMELVLERYAVGLDPLEEQPINRAIEGQITAKVSKFRSSSELLPRTSISIVTAPHEWAISLITDRLSCSPIAAQMCFAELLVRVGVLADANGSLAPEDYRGLSISDTETSIHNVLTAVDIDSIERALREGVCEPVDFLTPLNDPNFYLGVDVVPGHIAAGLVAERPISRLALVQGVEERRAALIIGPSGAGKSALMWEAANSLRHTVRWFQIRRLSVADIPAIRQLIRTFRASERSPVGFVLDDVGRNSPEGWGALLKEVMSVPGVVMLGSAREEDVTLIAERARAVEVRANPDDELAERLWKELRAARKTDWPGWREPWKLSDGLLLEYVHILTHGRRMQALLSDQVMARISDPTRALELDILRSGALAGAANAEIDASRLACTLSVSEADLSRALQRLIQEHLVRSPAPGRLVGLHQLRSEELLRLTHHTPLPTLETSFERTVASVSATDLEPLITDALSERRLPVPAVLNSVISRLEREPDARALASALRGLGAGRISAGVDEWLDSAEVRSLPRTQVGTAALFGITGTDLSSLGIIPDVQAAAARLSQIKGSPEDDPRCLLMERIPQFTLSFLIETADLVSLEKILGALVEMPLSEPLRSALSRVPTNLLTADLHLVRSLIGTLTVFDREIAIQWVREVGQEALFAKIQTETAWAGPVCTENEDDGRIVCCDFWYVAGSIQGNPHDAVVDLCGLILALCPSADVAKANAITESGELAGLAEFPLATKRIPRKNLPPPSITQWNRRWVNLVSRRVAVPSYSDYLAKGVAILETLVPTLEKIFDVYLRGKNVFKNLFEVVISINAAAETLTPPVISSLEASGAGNGDVSFAVTKFQNLLHSVSGNLITRFTKLPEHAGVYISWLNDLVADVNTVIVKEPWQLITDCFPQTLTRLKTLLDSLRLLAGEAHERQKAPVVTWAARGKGASSGNALGLITFSAKAAGETRLAQRKAQIELLAKETGIEAIFHLRINEKGILPWPPYDVLALLPTCDVANAVIILDQQLNRLRSLVDSSVHLTVMPSIDGVVFPALASAGYQTLFPNIEGAMVWAENIGLPCAPSVTAGLFGELLSLAGELGAMDRLELGIETRPGEEVVVRQKLVSSFGEKRQELIGKLNVFDSGIDADVFELVDHLRAGSVDFAAEAQEAFGGASSKITETAMFLTLLLIELEWQADKIKSELQ